MENTEIQYELPMGLSNALAKNKDAMNKFSSLSETQKKSVVEYTHQIRSKKEMVEFAKEIANGKVY